ncbi:hypothetical protein K7432_010514 [Basidiobolus ranarum]|uniref:Uncharacterized protein n=1 Tax=Basidiobolus ranarum TaxID=34480 RepID=A0ABR2WNS0_9FUNG
MSGIVVSFVCLGVEKAYGTIGLEGSTHSCSPRWSSNFEPTKTGSFTESVSSAIFAQEERTEPQP